MKTVTKIKFKDDFHHDTLDGFRVQNRNSKDKYVTVFQEDGNQLTTVILTKKDIEQIMEELTK